MNQTILTVDDSKAILALLKISLADEGYEVIQAKDGMHGLEKLKEVSPDVIITDINMPRLDGFGFIREVRKDPQFLGVPILVLTTESTDEKKNMARQAGATGWIKKPFQHDKLIKALQRVTVRV